MKYEDKCHICSKPYHPHYYWHLPSDDPDYRLVLCYSCWEWKLVWEKQGVTFQFSRTGDDMVLLPAHLGGHEADILHKEYREKRGKRRLVMTFTHPLPLAYYKLADSVPAELPNSTSPDTVKREPVGFTLNNAKVELAKEGKMRVSSGSISFDKEESGGTTTYTHTFEVKDGSKALLRCVVAVIKEEGEPDKLYTNVQPLGPDLGVELRREDIYSGDYARTYADAIAAARDLLGDGSGTQRGNSGRSVHIDLDI